ncbi:MAG: twin-arginine translocation signal domain-containing protein, partial [Woeseia sp.]
MATQAKKVMESISRRTFLAGTAGTGLIMGIGTLLPGCSREEAAQDIGTAAASKSFAPTVWFEIDGDGGILVNVAKAEMG